MHNPAALFPLAALLLAPAALLNAAAPALSQGQPTAAPAVVPAVVPAKERLQGPPEASQTQGVLAVKRLGGQPLGPAFAALPARELRDRELRVRELTIAPGGTVALHRHDHRPGVAYILEGQMTERRGPGFTPKIYGPGQVAFEGDGITHWWRNEGSTPSRAIVVDIVPITTR